MFESTIGIGAILSLAGKVCAQLDGSVLRKDVGGSDVGVFEVKHSHLLPVLSGAIGFGTSLFCLFRLLTTRWFVLVRSVGSRLHCAAHEGGC